MTSAADSAIYHNGRTYAEHCAWLDSLVGDEYRIVYTPIATSTASRLCLT